MTVLVDSDIVIEVSRGRDPRIVSTWTALSASDDVILYSPVSAAELWEGARPSEHAALTGLLRLSLARRLTLKQDARPANICGYTENVMESNWRTRSLPQRH